MIAAPRLSLSDGSTIPQLGIGTYKVPADVTADLVEGALAAGYRHVDTAALYGNETEVGEGLRASGLDRDDVFVTTKVWNDDQGFDETLRAFDASSARLGLDRVDLYLIHWPIPSADRYVDTWRALLRLQQEGRATSIGVSNFSIAHLERLRTETGVLPAVNQVELHPRFPQDALVDWDTANGIVTESWAPLARGGLLDEPVLARIAERYGKTPAQVVVRWHLDRGLVVFPKSVSPERIRENGDVFDFTLAADDHAAIAGLDTGERTGRDPALD
ncbi:aldo/keto reductase [Microbacterium proteolyticum]|uniref:aldo/keto reductase n=1 Tax=Microbacterium proteolyticum TaxID=1572644 RepID=UPI001FABA826|nr:aldo/keto reductase [Microbacterium proteolyticum]MCI9858591.1 aldo/keto reductase [Microbacterium proteolyticum]